ncbi:unnamed protein product, partial [Rotaria sp. Silwood2]
MMDDADHFDDQGNINEDPWDGRAIMELSNDQ